MIDGSPSVLVVDDDDLVRESLVELVSAAGMGLTGAAPDGATAIAMARAVPPDVVLMDMRMPGLTGSEATRAILQVAPATRVVMLTAHTGTAFAEEARAAGAVDFIAKGSPPRSILEAIRRAHGGDDGHAIRAS